MSDDQDRPTAVRLILLKFRPESALVFCNTKREAQEVATNLREHGFAALALHGDLEQRDRDQTLLRFANKSVTVLVATDVAARGLDIDSVDAVINYHIASDVEVHLHRIGRTGRAGSKGSAYSLISEKESYKVALLQDYLEQIIVGEPLPPIALLKGSAPKPVMATIVISGGKKQKIRPGDILGALTGAGGIAGAQVGKINISHDRSYVAVHVSAARHALKKLAAGKLNGRSFRSRLLRGNPEEKRDSWKRLLPPDGNQANRRFKGSHDSTSTLSKPWFCRLVDDDSKSKFSLRRSRSGVRRKYPFWSNSDVGNCRVTAGGVGCRGIGEPGPIVAGQFQVLSGHRQAREA